MRGDPNKRQQFTPGRRIGVTAFGMLLSLAFSGFAAALLLSPTADVGDRLFNLLILVLFGGAGIALIVQFFRRRPANFTAEGLSYGPVHRRKLIRWRDIEGFAVVKVANTTFNSIQLRDPAPLMAQYDPKEVAGLVRMIRMMRMAAPVIVPVAFANLRADALEAASPFLGSGDVANLEEALRFQRAKFGGEVLLTTPDRDRHPKAFHKLLHAWWSKHRDADPEARADSAT